MRNLDAMQDDHPHSEEFFDPATSATLFKKHVELRAKVLGIFEAAETVYDRSLAARPLSDFYNLGVLHDDAGPGGQPTTRRGRCRRGPGR